MRHQIFSPKFPTVAKIRTERIIGVNDREAEPMTPSGFAYESENLRFDRAIPRVRPGFDRFATTPSEGPITGMGVWRAATSTGEGENRKLLAYGEKTIGGTKRGALYSAIGAAFSDASPPDGTPLLGAGNDAYFAQFAGKVYGVDSASGVFLYDGTKELAEATVIVMPVDVPPDPIVGINGTLIDDGALGSWATNQPTRFKLNDGVVSPVPQWRRLSSDYAADGDRIYFDRGASHPIDLTADANGGGKLIFQAQASATGENIRFHIGTGDPTTADLDDATVDYAYVVNIGSLATWTEFEISFSDIPDDILKAVRYVLFECWNASAWNGQQISTGRVWSPGPLDVGTHWYKDRAISAETGAVSDATDGKKVIIGDVDYSGEIVGAFYHRALVTVDCSALLKDEDYVEVYRKEYDAGDEGIEAGNYYLVKTVTKSMAKAVDPTTFLYPFYDDVTEDDLPLETAALPTAVASTIDSTYAPKYILALDAAMIYVGSTDHPSRVWKSDIGSPVSVPNEEFVNVADAGRGGYQDAGIEDGDEFSAPPIRRMNEAILFKRSGVWAWTIIAEGTDSEEWRINKIAEPGCIAPRSVQKIPGAVCWFSESGLYVMPDDSDSAEVVPWTDAIQRTIDEIPKGSAHLASVEYHPGLNCLLLAVPEPGETANSCVLVYDLRTKAWAGKWVARGDSATSPAILFCDWIGNDRTRLYMARSDGSSIDWMLDAQVDAIPFADYGNPIAWKYVRGWREMIPGRKFRLMRRMLDFGFDEIADDSSLSASVTATLKLRARPGDASVDYDYEWAASWSDESDGLVVYSPPSDGDVDPTLEGRQAKIELSGTVYGAIEVRLNALELGYMDRGEWHQSS